jgi:hypothetical protein
LAHWRCFIGEVEIYDASSQITLIELEELKVNTSLRTQPNQKAFPLEY